MWAAPGAPHVANMRIASGDGVNVVATRKRPAKVRASSAEHARDDFLDIAAHELRTPLTALKGHVQLLQRRMRREGEREQDLAEINKMMYQIERLNHQLDIYLAASHIAHKKFAVIPAEADLSAIIRRVLDLHIRATTAHRFTLIAPDEPVVGIWDRRRIEQAYTALLANAVKFSPESSEIETRITRNGDAVQIAVSDRGVEVPAAERRRIFEPYVRGSNVENTGPGLGLYVAREAIRRQGGRVGMRARPGGGSTFWISLPLVAVTKSRFGQGAQDAQPE